VAVGAIHAAGLAMRPAAFDDEQWHPPIMHLEGPTPATASVSRPRSRLRAEAKQDEAGQDQDRPADLLR
jgi:hypothetical protein